MYIEIVLVNGVWIFTGVPRGCFNQTESSEIRITWFYAGGVISDGDRLASGLTPTFRGKRKKKKGDLATSGLDCSLNLDLIPFSLYKPLIESTSGSSLGFTASYLLPLYPFLFLRSSFWTFSFWTSFLVSAFPSLNYLREQPWQCMVIMSLACHIYLTSDIGIQRSCPRGHTGANSRRLASTMPSWMWQRGCGQPGMLGCRTTSWPLESCHSPCMNWSTSVARCLGFSLIHWECSTATRFRV